VWVQGCYRARLNSALRLLNSYYSLPNSAWTALIPKIIDIIFRGGLTIWKIILPKCAK
jgi:hypothetical protein